MGLVFEFPNLYRRLPPGIPTWGIARGHRLSLQKPWRNLGLFQHRDLSGKSRIGMIRADDLQRKVYVQVRSHYPPYLYGILRGIVEDTIWRYPGLEVREPVPCRCQPDCAGSFPLKLLTAKQERQEASVDCHTSTLPQSVIQLLTGLIPLAAFQASRGSEFVVLTEVRLNSPRAFEARRILTKVSVWTCPHL